MKSKMMLVGAAISLVGAILSAGAAISAQDKYALKCRVGSPSPSSAGLKAGRPSPLVNLATRLK